MKRFPGIAFLAAVVISITWVVGMFGEEPAQPTNMYIYSGILRSVDKQARTVVVQGSSLSQKFVVPTDTEIIVKDKPRGDLSDLMIGDGVQVKYTEDDGVFVAHQISLLGLKAP